MPLANAQFDWDKAGWPACSSPALDAFEGVKLRDVAAGDANSVRVVMAAVKAPFADVWAIHWREEGNRPLVYLYQFKDSVAEGATLTISSIVEELVKSVGWSRAVALVGKDAVEKQIAKTKTGKHLRQRLHRLDGFLEGCDVLFVLVTDKSVPGSLPPGVACVTRQQLLGSAFGPPSDAEV